MSNYYYADYDGGIKDFTKVLELNKDYVTALEWRGKCHQKANYINKACEDWELAMSKGLSSSKELFNKFCESE